MCAESSLQEGGGGASVEFPILFPIPFPIRTWLTAWRVLWVSPIFVRKCTLSDWIHWGFLETENQAPQHRPFATQSGSLSKSSIPPPVVRRKSTGLLSRQNP